jgi:hypothetical protein
MNRGYASGNHMSNTFQVNTAELFQQKVTAANMEAEKLTPIFTKEASDRSKAWLFLIAPVWGLLMWMLFYRRLPWLVPHVIYALHGLTFFIFLFIIELTVCIKILSIQKLGENYTLLLSGLFTAYNTVAIRRIYRLRWLASIVGGLAAVFSFLAVLLIYRQCITIWTLKY